MRVYVFVFMCVCFLLVKKLDHHVTEAKEITLKPTIIYLLADTINLAAKFNGLLAA